MKVTVAHSPDSDDAFMHYGIASGKVPTDGLEFDHVLKDIETLNRAAFDGKYEVSAVTLLARGDHRCRPGNAHHRISCPPYLRSLRRVRRHALRRDPGQGA
jgi:hypothetical protein